MKCRKVIFQGVEYYVYKSRTRTTPLIKITLYLCDENGEHKLSCGVQDVIHTNIEKEIDV